MGSKPKTIQSIHAGTIAISADDTTLHLLCWVNHAWKPKFGLQLNRILPVGHSSPINHGNRLTDFQTCQNNDHSLCGHFTIPILGQICHPSHNWRSRQRVHRCRTHQYRGHGHDNARRINCHCCICRNSILPSMDWKEDERFLSVEPPIALEPGSDICVIVGVLGAIF
jgi:hypothetical protein